MAVCTPSLGREGNTLAQTGTGLGQLEGLTQNSRVNRVADCCYRITAWLWIQTVSVKIRNLEQAPRGTNQNPFLPLITLITLEGQNLNHGGAGQQSQSKLNRRLPKLP